MRDEIQKFLRQNVNDGCTVESAKELVALAQRVCGARTCSCTWC
jgi:hypothetical protein